MICPRCSIVEIVPDNSRCYLCGLTVARASVSAGLPVAVGGNGEVAPEAAELDGFQGRVTEELGESFELQALWSQQEGRAVFLAQDTLRGHAVVLKLVGKDVPGRPYVRDFRRDAAQACRVTHPHLVPMIDFGTTRSFLWYSREYVTGRTLTDLLRETGPMTPAAARRVAEQLAESLDYLHDNEIVHGRVTPANIIVQTVNGEQWARLTDLSVVQSATGPVWQQDYVAPEQFGAERTPESVDQYALASVLYQCLTGVAPSAGAAVGGTDAAPDREPRSIATFRDDVPPVFVWAVHRALSASPDDRFQTVTEFASALGEIHDPEPKVVVRTEAAALPKREPRVLIVDKPPRAFPLAPVAMGAAAVLFGAVVVRALQPEPESAEWATVATAEVPATPPPPPVLAPVGPAAATAESDTSAAEQVVVAEPAAVPDASPAAGTTAPAGAPGTLFVNSTPWGQLFVDGTSLGNTPKANLVVTAGTHVIRIVRYGYQTYEREIQVGPGEVVRLTDIVLEAREP